MTAWEIREGDALERLREMPDRSVQCCVTSPPYFGLRDYGTGAWECGEADCDHKASNYDRGQRADRGNVMARTTPYRDVCGRCGARRVDRQIGLEATPDEFVSRLVDVFREVRRVLRDDGTLWLNIGDSYASGGGAGNQGTNGQMADRSVSRARVSRPRGGLQGGTTTVDMSLGGTRAPGCKPKDLLGIPWLLAFALRADGWYLRSDIIWAKPNPMPESVKDRPTSAHEHVFLLAKSARYFYDADAIREPHLTADDRCNREDYEPSRGRMMGMPDGEVQRIGTNGPSTWPEAGRNKRNVWEIATQPYSEAHFATFPPKLVEPCILAGSSPQACGECGTPWERVTERVDRGRNPAAGRLAVAATGGAITGGTEMSTLGGLNAGTRTVGWQPACEHHDDTGRSVILDPFAGAGTTGLVALRHGRSFIGIELNPTYAEMARERIRRDAPLLNTLAEVAS